MKKLSALLLLTLGMCLIQATNYAATKETPKAPPTTPPKTAAKTDPKTASQKTVSKAQTAKDAKAKPEEAAPIIGALIDRNDGSGGFINLKVDGGWMITFLDKDKKATKSDISRATIRYRKFGKDNQFILTASGDGKSLRCSLPVARPYIFPTLPIVLFKEGQEEAAETYMVHFKQPMPGDGEGTPIDEMTPEQLKQVPVPN